jgi:Nucleotidyl transferase of unknown function (DUF2204)
MSESQLPDDLLTALLALSTWLEEEAIPHATIGGVAVALIAQPRMTRDIDAVIWLEPDRWDDFIQSGAKYGIQPRLSDAVDFARLRRVLLLKHQPTGVDIDLSFGALPFEQEVIERAVQLSLGSLYLKISTPEDLIIMKAIAQRPKDLADIDAIIQTVKNIDHERVEYWVQQFADALEMPELMNNIRQLLLSSKASPRDAKKKKSSAKRKK